jgi:hypothetical protein
MQNMLRACSISLFILSATACGSDSTTSPNSSLAGHYAATTWMTFGTSGQTNQITAGSTLNITLNANGTTTGQIHVAASGTDPVFDRDMAGTWVQTGSTINFSQSADTFVRDMPFTLSSDGTHWVLTGDKSFNSTRILLALTQQ